MLKNFYDWLDEEGVSLMIARPNGSGEERFVAVIPEITYGQCVIAGSGITADSAVKNLAKKIVGKQVEAYIDGYVRKIEITPLLSI